ncbi:DNA topoisomerase IV subunit A [Salimicrobium halophilum]|uniref:DNA topoisomerase 4 subunit A n=1 Tax=Salimicrobium halophilum TaxID=86666 RepID=A0A1G8Q582_9BACI|nr:DNA topoisomerase IV subunit A [Salimicrobium halophilum]SDI99625.1 DNA topoisomerase IV subunit A [Salimicrobium halophilum]
MAETERLLDLPLEEVLGDRFGRYSKYIIQERALPDARDGLKPVQRRILYAMQQEKNTADKPYRKSAKTVGTVIGNYHPHGDSSVYEAMVRLSQSWKVRYPLVEMHGNNGSIDGDPPAAMRYTEARLAGISTELLRDIQKNTVEHIPNFDDTIEEPTVLPAKFPNLLVNGSTGISAGYATEIPPHRLEEVIDAVIMRIDSPEASVDKLMTKLPGPDFPTGGIIQGKEGLKEAYENGKGKIIVRGKAEIERIKGGKEQIVIDEVPYDVNKATMVKRMDELRIDKKVEGIAEVRDETDRTGLRIVIELKKEANSEGILNYLYKHTDLQVSYSFNMVAISDRSPKLMSLPMILDSYITHQKEVVTNQANYDLEKAKNRAHIVEGLIKAISILDEVISTIRASKDKSDAKEKLKNAYSFSEAQAEAIVTLQLYRLTNTDITSLEQEAEELQQTIKTLEEILADENKLLKEIKSDLRKIKKEYKDERRTVIEEKVEELKVDLEVTVASEDVLASVTKDGYVKRTSLRSYTASQEEDLPLKEGDHLQRLIEINTTDTLLLFTNLGKYLYIPVHKLPDIRWKDLGQHVANLVPIEVGEKIIEAVPVRHFDTEDYLVFVTKNGMVKRTMLKEYQAQRHSKPLVAINTKKDDEVVSVQRSGGGKDIMIASDKGYCLRFEENEVNPVGPRAAGVKGIHLKDGEAVVSGQVFDPEEANIVFVVSQRGAVKRMDLNEFEKGSRANRGIIVFRELKKNPHQLVRLLILPKKSVVDIFTERDMLQVEPFQYRTKDRYSNGTFVVDTEQNGEVVGARRKVEYEKPTWE